MAIDLKLIDKLLLDYKRPEHIIGENGLLKQLTKAVLERAMQVEMTEHLGYEKHDPAGNNSGNSRNGATTKTLKGDFGEVPLETPRESPFGTLPRPNKLIRTLRTESFSKAFSSCLHEWDCLIPTEISNITARARACSGKTRARNNGRKLTTKSASILDSTCLAHAIVPKEPDRSLGL